MTTTTTIRNTKSDGECTVVLRATETSELKLDFDLATTKLRSGAGSAYSSDTVRVLCGSGLALARSCFGLSGGLSVQIDEVTGSLDEEDERGVCYATAVAIATEIGRDPAAALEGADSWVMAE